VIGLKRLHYKFLGEHLGSLHRSNDYLLLMTIVCLLALTFFSIIIKTDKVYLSSSSFGNVINHVTKNVSNVDIDTSYFGNIFFTLN
jgi:hypothetical protein